MRRYDNAAVTPLHPEAQLVVDRAATSTEPPLETIPAAEARKLSDTRVANSPLPRHEMAEVKDVVIDGPAGPLKLRIYRPDDRPSAPVTLFFHGGGFMLGNLETHDALCRALAARSGSVFVAVEFRLAPEHVFPAASDDCLAATRWVLAHAEELGVDAARFAVAGESSGGNLAAGVALRLRAEDGPQPRLQLLLYPLVDMRLDHPSYGVFGEGYLLTTRRSYHYVSQYMGDQDQADPVASPLRDPHPERTLPTFVLVASHDPTVGPALDYADRLEAAGVDVDVAIFEGWTHGFLFWGHADGSLAAIDRAGAALSRALH